LLDVLVVGVVAADAAAVLAVLELDPVEPDEPLEDELLDVDELLVATGVEEWLVD
jgi:hypothetical protein